MRLFIAVDIDDKSKKIIYKRLKFFREKYKGKFKWVKKDNWHLTLKFFGKASNKDKNNIIKVLKSIKKNYQNQDLEFKQIAAFPNYQMAKVVYLKLGEGTDSLKKLHYKLESKLKEYAFNKDDREFIPHLTIARSKNNTIQIKRDFLNKSFDALSVKINNIRLYQSELKSDGPEYKKLFSIY